MDNVVSRYGIEEVTGWIFELTRDFHTEENKIYEDEQYDFFDVWKIAHSAVREKVPGALFGGISTVIQTDREFAVNLFKRCVKENYLPDFVSFFLYPYEHMKGTQGENMQRVATANSGLSRKRSCR